MPITYNNIQVKVSSTGILSTSASVETSNSLLAVQPLGFRGIIDQAPAGPLKSTISFDYFLKTDQDPNYLMASGLRSYISEGPVAISVGGVAGVGYLESYSIKLEPNQLARASASYACFTPLNGSLQNKLLNLDYTGVNPSGFGHSWSTYITNSTDYVANRTISFSYDFSAKWTPVYGIGGANPVSVMFNGGQETFSIAKDTYIKPTFSGINVVDYLTGLSSTNFDIRSVDVLCGNAGNSINIDMSNSKVVSSSLSTQVRDVARTNTVLTRYF